VLAQGCHCSTPARMVIPNGFKMFAPGYKEGVGLALSSSEADPVGRSARFIPASYLSG